MKNAFIIFCRVVLFIILTTLNAEYLINRTSSTLLTVLAVFLEIALIYVFIYPIFKNKFK